LRPWTLALAVFVACSPFAASECTAAGADGASLRALPERPRDGITGSQFARRTAGWPEPDRQRAALDELERGNVPSALGRFWPVELRYQPERGEAITATIWAAPDYLAIGSDEDFLYIPLTWPSATEVAQAFGCVLPTPKMVDAIHAQARVQLEPRPLPAGPEMRSNAYYARHQRIIDAQRAGVPVGTSLSGHMKDLVLSDRLFDRPDRVAIYGWHRLDGRPIQPLSTVHGVRYADYSHGVRLIWREVWIGGARRPITDVLADPELARVLSDEGVIRDPAALLDPSRARVARAGADGARAPSGAVAAR